MARSDLIIDLVKAGTSGDRSRARSIAEAILAEERAKQHTVLADKIDRAIERNGNATLPNRAALERGPRGRDFLHEIVPRRLLQDLILSSKSYRSILELIEEQQRADLLRAFGLEPRHRILLTGAPGTGKTSLAEAIAEAIGVPMLVVRYESMIGSYLGETASRLHRIFDYARTTPSMLFFDEFDTIGKERGDTHETGEIKRVVSTLLMQMDDLPSYTVLVAATNHPELLDRAAWRRFQLRLDLPMPSEGQIAKYIKDFTSRFNEPLGRSPLAIARSLGPVSFSDVEQFCLDLSRREVLAQGQIPLKRLVDERLELWSERFTVNCHGAPRKS